MGGLVKPALQVAGKQAAEIPAPPACKGEMESVSLPVPVVGTALPALTETTVGFVLVHVRGGLRSVSPAASVTVAVRSCAPLPFARLSDVPPVAVCKETDSTGQVAKVTVVLLLLPAEA